MHTTLDIIHYVLYALKTIHSMKSEVGCVQMSGFTSKSKNSGILLLSTLIVTHCIELERTLTWLTWYSPGHPRVEEKSKENTSLDKWR